MKKYLICTNIYLRDKELVIECRETNRLIDDVFDDPLCYSSTKHISSN